MVNGSSDSCFTLESTNVSFVRGEILVQDFYGHNPVGTRVESSVNDALGSCGNLVKDPVSAYLLFSHSSQLLTYIPFLGSLRAIVQYGPTQFVPRRQFGRT
jgi:hypothetical protein